MRMILSTLLLALAFHEKNRISCGAGLFNTETQSHGDTEQSRASVPLGLCASVLKTTRPEGRIPMANHWIPFAESEVDSKDAYQSHFMVEFLRRVGGAASGRAGPAGYREPENPAPSQGLLFGGAHGFGEERGGRRNPEAECNASQEIGLRAEGEEEKDLRPVSTSDAKQTSLPLRSAETPRFKPLAGEPPAPPKPLAAEGGVPYDGDAASGRVAAIDAAESRIPAFSSAAQAVFDAGRALWRYYHAQPSAVPDASLYDIRAHFQGFNSSNGHMNADSSDPEYTRLIGALRAAERTLAARIAPKVRQHSFLR